MTIGRIPSVEGGIQPTIVDAKGDLIAGVAADSVNRLAVGSNDQVLVADSAASTGMAWKSVATPFAAGKNKIINGDFNINQRAFTTTTSDAVFNFDRFYHRGSGGTCTVSAQTFTLGTAPVTGYEGKNFIRLVSSGQSGSTDQLALEQRIESVRTLANEVTTVSFWAKAASGTPKIAIEINQNFGTGGSPSAGVTVYFGQVTLSTSWARYSATLTVPSISGKTLGTANDNFLSLKLFCSAGSSFDARTGTLGIQNNTFDFWGVQVEAGSVATAFQTATGTLQGELAAAQRYYWRATANGAFSYFGWAIATGGSGAACIISAPVTFRVAPTSIDYSNISLYNGTTNYPVTSLTIDWPANNQIGLAAGTGSTLTSSSMFRVLANNNSAAYIGVSAEL